MNHDLLMKRCIDLGKKALGKTYPNPNVGALLFYDGKIISEGFTQEHGKNHAEINAIKKVNDREILKKSTLYVTLEPCSHYGKTPPCCEAIYNKQIRKVVIGINDPNKLVNGSGISFLRSNNIYYRNYGNFNNKNQILNFPDKSSIKLETIKTMRKFWESKV